MSVAHNPQHDGAEKARRPHLAVPWGVLCILQQIGDCYDQSQQYSISSQPQENSE